MLYWDCGGEDHGNAGMGAPGVGKAQLGESKAGERLPQAAAFRTGSGGDEGSKAILVWSAKGTDRSL